MTAVSATSARANLYRLIDQVNEESEPLTITGQRGNAVLVGEEDWLANDPVDGIGQLVGERPDTIWVTPGDDRPLLLRRPTAAVEAAPTCASAS